MPQKKLKKEEVQETNMPDEVLIDFGSVTLADYYECEGDDLFDKAKHFHFFMEECRKRRYHFLERILETSSGSHVIIQDPYTGGKREMIMMASNNYLGLTTHPKVVEAGLKAMKKYAPEIFYGLKDAKGPGRSYKKLPDISLDYAMMEKMPNVYCLRGAYEWNDMGSFKTLKKVLRRESRSYREEAGKVTEIL